MKKTNKHFISLVALSLFIFVIFLSGCGAQQQNENTESTKHIAIGTASTGATYYPIGGAIAELINQNVENVEATAITTGGSVENLRLLNKGEIGIGFAMVLDSMNASKGVEPFNQPIEGIRAIATIYPNTWQMVTRKDSGIKTYEQLKGKKVGVGPAGSGIEVAVKLVTENIGMTYDDFNPLFLGGAEAIDALQNKQVDAAAVGGSLFNGSLKGLASTVPVYLIPIDDTVIQDLVNTSEGAAAGYSIPANTYAGTDIDSLQMDWVTQLVVKENEDEEIVYQIVKAIYDNQDKLAATHEAGKYITLERAASNNSGVTFHPGAVKYYKEKGVWKD